MGEQKDRRTEREKNRKIGEQKIGEQKNRRTEK